MSTYCVECILNPDQRDLASAFWYSLGMLGFEEEMHSEGVRVKVFFPDLKAATLAGDDLRSHHSPSSVSVYEVQNQDWNKKWRESMEPARLTPEVWVSPIWLPPPMKQNEHWIKIEPKMAFGTGHHETTRLAGQAIFSQKNWLAGKTVLDIGTGSGVLCFVAQICGSSLSVGVEQDHDCLENLSENHAQNTFNGKIGFLIGSVDCLKSNFHTDLAVMNMIMTESEPLLLQLASLLKSGGVFIWSGILVDEKEAAIKSAKDAGFEIFQENTEHEWWCGLFRKREISGI